MPVWSLWVCTRLQMHVENTTNRFYLIPLIQMTSHKERKQEEGIRQRFKGTRTFRSQDQERSRQQTMNKCVLCDGGKSRREE